MIERFLPFVLALVLPAGASAQITPPPPSSAETVPEQIAEAALTCQFLLDAVVPVSVVIVANFDDGTTLVFDLSCEQVMQRFDRYVAAGVVAPLPPFPAPTTVTDTIIAADESCTPDVVYPVRVDSPYGFTLYEVCNQ